MSESNTSSNGLPWVIGAEDFARMITEILRARALNCQLSIEEQLLFADHIGLGFMLDRHGYVELGGGDA